MSTKSKASSSTPSKNTKTETKSSNGNSKSTDSNGKEMTIKWLESPYKAENRKTYFNAFEKDGVQYSQKDYVNIGKDNSLNMPSVVGIQIDECWEEQNGKSKEYWFSGTPFILSSLINKKSPSREVISSRLTQTLRIKSIQKKVTIQNIDTIEDLDTFTSLSDHYYYRDMKEVFNMENSVESFIRPKKKSRRYADTTPELLLEKSPIIKKKNGSTPRKPWKKHKRGDKNHEDSDSSSDEERSYLRSLKRRQALEVAEKRAIAEHREKIEQDYLNNSFFRNKKQIEEMDSEYKSLLEATIVDSSILPKELQDQEIQQETESKSIEQLRDELPVPGFHTLAEEDCISLNTKADAEFWKKYQAGYVQTTEEEVTLLNADYETPKKSWKEFKKNAKIVNKFFDNDRWSEEEAMYFKELLCAYGTNWKKISHFIASKTVEQLEDFYKNNGYDILCQICGSTSDDARLLLCDACDKAYHTYCLKPPLKTVPKTLWFCNSACESNYKPKCETCRKEEESKITCISCNRYYHPQCLVPPLESVPTDAWTCPSCTSEMNIDESAPKAKASEDTDNKKDEDEDDEDEEIIIDTKDDESATSEALTKRIDRTCQKLCDSHSYSSLPFDHLRMWAERCIEIDISRIREDQISTLNDYTSIFSASVDCYDKKYLEHFTGLLQAVNMTVDKLVKNPKPPVIVKPQNESTPRKRRSSSFQVEKSPKAERAPRKKKNSGSDGFGEGPRAWIFQANRQIYNIEKSIKNLPTMTWFIKQHIYKIKGGDKVYIWVTGKDGGIIATATVLTDPTEIPEHKGMKKYYLNGKIFDGVALRSYLKVDYILGKKLDKAYFAKNHLLKHATIMRQPIGTNFKLTKAEMEEVDKLIESKCGKLIEVKQDDTSSDKVFNKLKKKTKSPKTKSPSKNETVVSMETEEVVVTPKKKERRGKSKSPKTEKSPKSTVSDVKSPEVSKDDIFMTPVKTRRSSKKDELDTPVTPNTIPVTPNGTPAPETKCEICLSTGNQQKLLLCDACDQGFHLDCIDPPMSEFPQENWYCNKCLILNSKGCKVCEGTDDDDSMLLCDMCDEGYHMQCLDPPLDNIPDSNWFCPNCAISQETIVHAKQLLGFKEVNLSCKRILHELCEELHYKHHRNMTQYHTVDKVLKKLRKMVTELGENRSKLITAANVAYQAWKVNLSSSLKSSENEET